jgi:phosphonopyruvate decarboxylase
LQNSGLGNAINPLVSLSDPEIYAIPVLLMIGWRGEVGVKDEPQHIKQGRITPDLLNIMEIPFHIIDSDTKDLVSILKEAIGQIQSRNGPVALLVRKGAFKPYNLQKVEKNSYQVSREQAIKILVNDFDDDDLVVATTGMISRELYEFRIARDNSCENDFLTVGSMGHASSIALGLAQCQSNRRVICLDGDGSVLMHMGSLAIVGQSKQRNLIHIVLNNGAHDSVGGQPTCGFGIDIAGVARSCGYSNVMVAESPSGIRESFEALTFKNGPSLLEIRLNKGARIDLGRPKSKTIENRNSFMIGLTTRKI